PDPARGRHPERGLAAVGLRVPHPLPEEARRDLRAAGTAAPRGRGRPSHALPHPDRRAPRAAGEGGRARMRVRGVVLEQTGGPLTLRELDLADPGPEEVLVRLYASGVCHSDWNAVDGTSETVCPAVLGHEGAGVVEQIGAGVTRVQVGDHVALSWTPW